MESYKIEDREDLEEFYYQIRETDHSQTTLRGPNQVSIDNRKMRGNSYRTLDREFSSEELNYLTKLFHGWDMHSPEDIAEIFNYCSERKRNLNIPVKIQSVDNVNFREDLIDRYVNEVQRDLKERFGRQIPLYRGLNEEGFEDMQIDGGGESVQRLRHRPVESWTLSPRIGSRFGGSITLRKFIDIDDVFASPYMMTGRRFETADEAEFFVMNSDYRDYEDLEVMEDIDLAQNASWALSNL